MDADGIWRNFIDTGGTFTDALGLGPDGQRVRAKLLSGEGAELHAVRS